MRLRFAKSGSYAYLSSPGQGVVRAGPSWRSEEIVPEGSEDSQDMSTSAPCVASPGCVPRVEGVCPVKVTVALGQ